MTSFINELKQTTKPIKEFNESLWRLSVDKVVVEKTGEVVFFFNNGEEVSVNP